MKIARFEYHRPESVAEALLLLADLGDDAKVLAGGQSLVPLMALRLSRPGHVIDIGRLTELGTLSEDGGAVRVGALARHAQLETSTEVAQHAPLLAAAIPHIGHRAIRNRGTAGGSLAHSDPAAELPAVAVALGSELHLRSTSGERTVPATQFFTGFLTNAVGPDELLVEWTLPAWSATAGWSVQEVSRRHGDFALLGCAATIDRGEDGTLTSAALAFFGAGSTPVRVPEAEAVLVGHSPEEQLFAEAADVVKKTLDPPGDLHATAAHRRQLGAVLTRRCLQEAGSRLGAAA